MTLTRTPEGPPSTLYIAGGMTGLPEFNYPAFHAAALRLRAAGYKALNPAANHKGRTDLPYATYIRTALKQVMKADAVAVLPGWEKSQGARLEVHTAQVLGLNAYRLECIAGNTHFFSPVKCLLPPMSVYGHNHPACVGSIVARPGDYPPPLGTPKPTPIRAQALDAAKAAVVGDRNRDYGGPFENFTQTAALLNALGFGRDMGDDAEEFSRDITAADIAVIMTQVKVSRLHTTPAHRDTWTDIAGYAGCGAEVADREAGNVQG